MSLVPGLVLPGFYRYFGTPVKLVDSPDGGIRGWRLSMVHGGWDQADDIIDEILFAVGGDVHKLSCEDFVQTVESFRAHYLSGDGPIFALYETVDAIIDAEERERRYLTPEERAIVQGIRRRTFVMFEEQLRRQGDPGADPSVGQRQET